MYLSALDLFIYMSLAGVLEILGKKFYFLKKILAQGKLSPIPFNHINIV
jgi:hypothetical protein